MHEEIVRIVDFEEKYIEETFTWVQDKEFQKLFTMRAEPTWQTHVNYFQKILKDPTQRVFAILYEGKHVGNCGLKYIEGEKAEFWIYVGDKSYRNKKIAYRASLLVINYAEKRLNLKRIFLHVLNINIPAIRLYESLGFFKICMDQASNDLFAEKAKDMLKMQLDVSHARRHYFIIAGSNLQYNFVKRVKERGFITHVFDYDPNCKCKEIADYFHCISIDEKEEILKIAKIFNPVAVCTVACEMANISACYVSEKLQLNSNSYETALNTTDKARMKQICKKFNIPNAKHIEIKDISSVDAASLSYPLVIKPADTSAGRGVTRVDKKEEFESFCAVAFAKSRNKTVLLEEVLLGPQYSIETISYKNKHQIVGVTEEYFDGTKYFIESQHLLPARLDQNTYKQLEELTYKILNAFQVTNGASHIEVKLTSEGFKLIEIASRVGGLRDVLIKHAYGDDINDLLIDVTLEIEPVVRHQLNGYAIAKFMLNKSGYDFYLKLKKEEPDIIVHDEVLPFQDKKAYDLIDAQGFYYIAVPKDCNVTYYLEGKKLW